MAVSKADEAAGRTPGNRDYGTEYDLDSDKRCPCQSMVWFLKHSLKTSPEKRSVSMKTFLFYGEGFTARLFFRKGHSGHKLGLTQGPRTVKMYVRRVDLRGI